MKLLVRTTLRLMKATAVLLVLIAAVEAQAQEFKFDVRHDHTFGSCRGELIINGEGIEYRTAQRDHARNWLYRDIKLLKLIPADEMTVFTYESSRLKLGRDEKFEFRVTTGAVPSEVREFLLARLERPLTIGSVKPEEKPAYEIAVRHRHTFGGEPGTLKIYTDRVAYISLKSDNSRTWRWNDIEAISRTGRTRLAITTYEPKFGGPAKTYNFDLKEGMSDAVFDFLWSRVYKLVLPATKAKRGIQRGGGFGNHVGHV